MDVRNNNTMKMIANDANGWYSTPVDLGHV